MDLFQYPYGRIESLRGRELIATYLASVPNYDLALSKVAAFAVGQTVGTWVRVPGMSQKMIEAYQGRVLSVLDANPQACEDKRLIIRIAFPTEHFGDSLSMMLTALVGNDVSTALAVKLLDIEFTDQALRDFPGPRQTIDHLRALTNVYSRPLVLNMIKPCSGFTPEEGAALFRQVALGGVDMIKDDELLGSPSYNPVVERTKQYLRMVDEVFEQTGKRVLYLPNITGTTTQIRENIKAVIDLGAKACLLNVVFTGYDTLREVCETFGDQIFIMVHYAGVGVMNSLDTGISNSVLLGLLPRIAGAHAVMTMHPNQNDAAAVFDFHRTVQAQRLPLGHVNPVITVVGGGITPVNQEILQYSLGQDVVIGIGGAIQGHPFGSTAGAQAAMYAVEAVAKGRVLKEAGKECEALRKALEIWGSRE